MKIRWAVISSQMCFWMGIIALGLCKGILFMAPLRTLSTTLDKLPSGNHHVSLIFWKASEFSVQLAHPPHRFEAEQIAG